VAASKHRQTERLLATLQQYLLDIQQMMTNEKYPGGMSQKQRLLAMEEAHALVNGYSYFDNGEEDHYSVGTSNSDDNGVAVNGGGSGRSSISGSNNGGTATPSSSSRKVGKRLMLRKTD
jgi:carnitine O-acetyltransferase